MRVVSLINRDRESDNTWQAFTEANDSGDNWYHVGDKGLPHFGRVGPDVGHLTHIGLQRKHKGHTEYNIHILEV